MALIQGITGGLSGKMGTAVFRQRHGETVVTQYQPKVANPKSDGQTLQRAKFKLVSQLGSILDGFIAIPRSGATSARNQFASLNNEIVSAKVDGGEVVGAEINLANIKLTKSAIPFGSFSAAVFQNNAFVISGFGTLAVTNRPERRRSSSRATSTSNAVVSLLVLEAQIDPDLAQVGGPQPPRIVAYGSAVPTDGVFSATLSPLSSVSVDFNKNKYVALAYESLPISASTEESFDNILADSTDETAIAVVQFARSVNYTDILVSDTLGIIIDTQ